MFAPAQVPLDESHPFHSLIISWGAVPKVTIAGEVFYDTKTLFSKHNLGRDVIRYCDEVDWFRNNKRFFMNARGVVALAFAKRIPQIKNSLYELLGLTHRPAEDAPREAIPVHVGRSLGSSTSQSESAPRPKPSQTQTHSQPQYHVQLPAPGSDEGDDDQEEIESEEEIKQEPVHRPIVISVRAPVRPLAPAHAQVVVPRPIAESPVVTPRGNLSLFDFDHTVATENSYPSYPNSSEDEEFEQLEQVSSPLSFVYPPNFSHYPTTPLSSSQPSYPQFNAYMPIYAGGQHLKRPRSTDFYAAHYDEEPAQKHYRFAEQY